MEGFFRLVIAYSHHFDKELNLDPHPSEKSDPDPHKSKKPDPDPFRSAPMFVNGRRMDRKETDPVG